MKPAILEKSVASAKICISRFLVKHNLTHRVITHKAHHSETLAKELKALKFLEYIHPHMADGSRHPDYIINMDQTPVWHAMDSSRTIDRVGVRNVSMRTSNNDSKRVTVAVSITASGRRVKTMVVFKGEIKCND